MVFLRLSGFLILQRSFKNIEPNETALQWSVPDRYLGRGLKTDMAQSHGIVGDEPALKTLEIVLQRVADFLIQ